MKTKLMAALLAVTAAVAGAVSDATGRMAGAVSDAASADYARVEMDVSALPPDKAFLGPLVLSRAWMRTLPAAVATTNRAIRADAAVAATNRSACADAVATTNRAIRADAAVAATNRAACADAAGGGERTLRIVFRLDETLEGETARVVVTNGTAEVRGGRVRALVAGAGVLLRAIRWGERTFALADGAYRFAPAKPFRQAYLARHFDNWYHRASADELVRYAEDLALWGINAFHVHLDYPMVDAAKATPGDRAVFAAASAAFGARVAVLDCDLTTIGGENTAPEDMPPAFRATPDKKANWGATQFNVCPAKPGALDYLLGIRRDALRRAEGIPVSGYVYWPFDEGGCACDACAPWGGRGFPRLMEMLMRLNAAATPGAKHIVSTWLFREADWAGFYDYLSRQDWIDYLLVDSHGDFPKYPLTHPIPKNIPVITFPEISMWGRFPWGGTGANPLPGRFERLFRQAEHLASGFQLYSEGIYEDVNKIVINGLYVDPSRGADDILAEYAAWELPGADAADFVRLARLLEDIYCTKLACPGARKGWRGCNLANYLKYGDVAELARRTAVAAEAAALADKIDVAILPAMRAAWRWRQIYLRAKIDAAVYAARDIRPPSALAAYGELTALYHAERQAEGLFAGTWRGYTCPPFAENAEIRAAAAQIEAAAQAE